MTLRTIPLQSLGHGSDCSICGLVDRWAENRKPTRRLSASAGRSDIVAVPPSAFAAVERPADVPRQGMSTGTAGE